jgi:hypothetical protein
LSREIYAALLEKSWGGGIRWEPEISYFSPLPRKTLINMKTHEECEAVIMYWNKRRK